MNTIDAIIVKGIKMPECCYDCPLCYDNYMCIVLGQRYFRLNGINPNKERLKDCPLIGCEIDCEDAE